MTFEKITENVENISLLPDNPILSPAELKAEFDKGNKIIKEKFNKLIDDLNNEGVGDTFPIGAITEYPVSESVPNNWLLCNGQAVSRIEYEELFEILGTTWGTGDGSTTFNLPNRAGLIAIGAGTHTDTNGDSKTFVLGQEYGEYEHTLSIAEMPEHRHDFENGNGTSIYPATMRNGGSNELEQISGSRTYDQLVNSKAGGSQSHNNIQPSIATNFIIKARQSAGVSASVIQEDGTPNETDVYSSEAVEAKIEDRHTYSTTEKRIGTWIDDKPIYRKVITINLTTTMGEQDVSSLNIDKVIHLEGISQDTDPITSNYYWTEDDKFRAFYFPVNTRIRVQIGSSYPVRPCTVYVILEYTKTTD